MRREELYLTDMVEAADAISQFVLGVEQDLKNIPMKKHQILRRLFKTFHYEPVE